MPALKSLSASGSDVNTSTPFSGSAHHGGSSVDHSAPLGPQGLPPGPPVALRAAPMSSCSSAYQSHSMEAGSAPSENSEHPRPPHVEVPGRKARSQVCASFL